MIASVCLLVGLALGVCLSTVTRAYARKPRALPPQGETVYVFEGVVFPAPHDPRWERVEAQDGSGDDVFVFGDRDIRLSATTLSVGWGGGDGVRHAISGDPASRVLYYFADVQRCHYYFRRTLALASVEPAILNAGFAAERPKGTGDGVPEKREEQQSQLSMMKRLKALRLAETLADKQRKAEELLRG